MGFHRQMPSSVMKLQLVQADGLSMQADDIHSVKLLGINWLVEWTLACLTAAVSPVYMFLSSGLLILFSWVLFSLFLFCFNMTIYKLIWIIHSVKLYYLPNASFHHHAMSCSSETLHLPSSTCIDLLRVIMLFVQQQYVLNTHSTVSVYVLTVASFCTCFAAAAIIYNNINK